MKKDIFRTLPATSWLRRWRLLKQRGWFSLGLGGLIFLLLLGGNVCAYSSKESLGEREDEAFQQPPQWVFLQRLLYRPLPQVFPYVDNPDVSSAVDEWLGGFGDDVDPQEESLSPEDSARQNEERVSYRMDSTPVVEARKGYRYRYRARAYDAVRYELLRSPDGMEIDPASGQIAWLPGPEHNGPVPVEVAATNEEGARARQSFDVVVAPFWIISQPVYAATMGRRYRYRVRTDGTGAHYELLFSPDGMEIDPASGQIAWLPGPEHNGPVPVEVAAIDEAGEGVRQTFEIIVSERFHGLGTDKKGQDLFAVLVLGTRWTIWPGLLAVGVSLILGLYFGARAGYYKGRLDTRLSRVTRVMEAFPALVLLFVAAVIFQFNLVWIMVSLGLILFPGVAGDVRAKVQVLREQQFVEASQELGLSDHHILWIDIIWYNARALLLRRVFYGLALAVVIEVTLSYINIGIQNDVSWGSAIHAGRLSVESFEYWIVVFPALATIFAVIGYYALGIGLERLVRIKKT